MQELRGLRAFRALLLQHLGGSEAYVLYGGDLGTSLTGVTDALTLLVRKDVVDEGQFEVRRQRLVLCSCIHTLAPIKTC